MGAYNFLLIFGLIVGSKGQGNEGAMKYVLDGMHEMMEGTGTFDEDLYDSLVQCFEQSDPELMASQDAVWAGMIEWAASGGAEDDEWLSCDEAEESKTLYHEFNCTIQDKGDLPIFEPCDYSSNIAYYHTMLELCARDTWNIPSEYVLAQIQTFAFLAPGSSFFHGSQTELGHQADIRLNDLFAFVAYQAAVSRLAPLDSSVIHHLSNSPRSKMSYETTAYLQNIFLNQPVDTWTEELRELDIPGIRLGACAFISTGAALVFEDQTLEEIVVFFLDLLGIVGEDRNFCVDSFLPAIEEATAEVNLDAETQGRLFKGVIGMGAKLFYGALWQEELLPDNPLYTRPGSALGARLLPSINTLINTMLLDEDDFPHDNPDFQLGIGVYPGENSCNPSSNSPHAKWHLETGIGLVDWGHLADLYFQILPQAEDSAQLHFY